MDTKSIIATLQDLESGFLTEEHMEAISAAIGVLEKVDREKIAELLKKTFSWNKFFTDKVPEEVAKALIIYFGGKPKHI